MPKDDELEDLEAVETAFARLRPLEREVLLLSARERLSRREIALRLGLSPAAVERHLARALRKLDRMLAR